MLKVKFIGFYGNWVQGFTLPILRKHFGEVIECDDPDFLFYGPWGIFEAVKYDCVRIFWTGENVIPDFNICDYAIGFQHLEFEDRYKRIPIYHFYDDDYKLACGKHLVQDDATLLNRKFCSFVYSNGTQGTKDREEFYNKLSEYKTVDSGGRFMNNVGGPVKNKLDFQKQYKFSIAFENTSFSGYTTEKLVQSFAANTIPIYWGDPRVCETFNKKAFINCFDYSDFDEVVELVKRIDQDDELYLSYLREPAFLESEVTDSPLQRYEDFLIHICSQTPAEAMRRNNYMFGKRYQEQLTQMVEQQERKHHNSFRRRFFKR